MLGADGQRLAIRKWHSGSAQFFFIMFCIMLMYDSTLQQPIIQYLRGGPRLNNSRVWDYYFYCYMVGPRLTWQVNERTLAGFVSENTVGRVFSREVNDYRFMASLILSRPSSNAFASILILTTSPNRALNISCWSEVQFPYTVSVNAHKQTITLNSIDASGNVFLQYLFSHSIKSSIRLHLYICGVNSDPLKWLTIAQVFGFENNIVGDSISFLSDDKTFVNPQAVLIGSSPYSFVSVLIVTSSGVNVTCLGSMRTRTTIFFREIEDTQIDMTIATTEPRKAMFSDSTVRVTEDMSSSLSSTSTEGNIIEVESTASTATQGRDSYIGTTNINATGVDSTISTLARYRDPHIGIAVAIPLSVAIALVPVSLLIYYLMIEFRKKLKSRGNRTESRTNIPAACALDLSSSTKNLKADP